MSEITNLQERIEQERARLDQVMEEGDFEVYYAQSVLLDRLIEQYIELTEETQTGEQFSLERFVG